jgi:hypothetical protein
MHCWGRRRDWRIGAKQELERKGGWTERAEWLLFEIWVGKRADICVEVAKVKCSKVRFRRFCESQGCCFESRGRENEGEMDELKWRWHFSAKRKCPLEEFLERRRQFRAPLLVLGAVDGPVQ